MAMTIAQVDGSLVVIDHTVAHWLFYGCFVAGGIAALYLSFFTPADTLSAAAGVVVGLGNIAWTPGRDVRIANEDNYLLTHNA